MDKRLSQGHADLFSETIKLESNLLIFPVYSRLGLVKNCFPPKMVSATKPSEITIKINTVKRTIKELKMYQTELAHEKSKLEKITEPHEHRKQQEVIEETNVMIPDTKKRLERAMEDIKQYEEGREFLKSLEQ